MSATPQRCGNTEPHGSHRFQLDQDSRGYVWSWRNCPGTGTAEPKPAVIDAAAVADAINAERELWLRQCTLDIGVRLVIGALDSLTGRLAANLPPDTFVEFFKRCGHTQI